MREVSFIALIGVQAQATLREHVVICKVETEEDVPEGRRIEGRIYLSADQVNARRVVLMHAYAAQDRRPGDFKIVFLEGPGGTGKTELINHILDTLRVAGGSCSGCIRNNGFGGKPVRVRRHCTCYGKTLRIEKTE